MYPPPELQYARVCTHTYTVQLFCVTRLYLKDFSSKKKSTTMNSVDGIEFEFLRLKYQL